MDTPDQFFVYHRAIKKMDDHHASARGNRFVDRTKGSSNNPKRVCERTKARPADQVDVIALVRSLQRTAGITDCFRRGNADCDSIDCDWRAYCLGGLPEKKETGCNPKKKR
jgi:hypothetical protein